LNNTFEVKNQLWRWTGLLDQPLPPSPSITNGQAKQPISEPTISCLDEQGTTNSTRGLRSGQPKLQEQESLQSFRKAP